MKRLLSTILALVLTGSAWGSCVTSGSTDEVIFFVAVDSTDFTTRETGLTTFTVYRARGDNALAAMTTPTVTELSAANAPGLYKLDIDEDTTITSGKDREEMVFHITQASMAPVTRTIELCRPKITAGNTLGVAADGDVSGNLDGTVATVTTLTGHTAQTGDSYARLGAPAGASIAADVADVPTVAEFNARTLLAASYFDPALDTVANVTTVATTTTNTDMRGTDSALLAASAPTNFGDLSITATTGLVSVGTNNDKSGYALAQPFPTNFADLAITSTTGLVSVGTNNDKTGYSLTQSFPTNFADLDIEATTGHVDLGYWNGTEITTPLETSTDIAAAVQTIQIEDQGAGYNLQCAIATLLAYVAGELSTTGGVSTYQDPSGTENRLVGTVSGATRGTITITCP